VTSPIFKFYPKLLVSFVIVQFVNVKLLRLPFFKVIRLSSKPSTNKPFASSKPNNYSPDL
jgi:hypothetical protein